VFDCQGRVARVATDPFMNHGADLGEALTIPPIEAAGLALDHCRRLTGPGYLWDHMGAVAEVRISGHDPATVIATWDRHAARLQAALGWTSGARTSRPFDGGAILAISAPQDRLFTAAFALETAWHFTAAEVLGVKPGDYTAMLADLQSLQSREADPALVALVTAAEAHGLDVLADDELLTIGHGTGAETWSLQALPPVADVVWSRLHNIPVALITGTNGKTTTTRLLASIAAAAGRVAGLSSTDGVLVGRERSGSGDYSGPAGARMVLRDHRVEVAALEVARGGILRRGLSLRRAAVGVVTNVAADHLGHYGIMTLPELAQVKLAIRRGLVPGAPMVLNADDENVVAGAVGIDGPIWWFAMRPDVAHIMAARVSGTPCAWVENGALVLFDGTSARPLLAVGEIPIALNGAAAYNLQNAMAAILCAKAMGLPLAAMAAALRGFQGNAIDNPGRCNEFSYGGARVFVDFAHNPHSIAAVTGALAPLPARRRFILMSHAGDRSDQDIRDLVTGAMAFRPDVVVAAENPGYLRGRTSGEVPGLIRDAAVAAGLSPASVLDAPSPAAGARLILDQLAPGDMALLLVHDERARIYEMLGAQVPQ
jgi:cyanophycin synthetase